VVLGIAAGLLVVPVLVATRQIASLPLGRALEMA
jgi:hypothetical protein